MLQLTPQSLIFVANLPVDFRKGIDGLCALCKQKLSLDPLSGSLFLFYNKSKTAIKILSFDGQGFWLCAKRLSKGSFKGTSKDPSPDPYRKICYRAMHILIHSGDPDSAKLGKNWKPVT